MRSATAGGALERPTAAGRPLERRSFEAVRRRFFAVCLLPALLVLGVVIVLPTIHLLVTSLTPLNLTRPETFGDFSQPLGNYRLLWSDAEFHHSLWVQAKLSFWAVGLQLVVGFLFALLLSRRSRFVEALRTAYLVPMVLPPIVVAIIWKIIYTPDISPFHQAASFFGLDIPSLITDPGWALFAVILAESWQWFPFTMLMVIAGLQMIPDDYVDAARIDGAASWQVTLFILLPLLRGVLLVAALFRFIDSIKIFPMIFVLTRGGPGAVTEVTNFYSFQQAFEFSFLGYSSAITVVLVLITILLTWIVIRTVGRGAVDG